MRLVNIEIAELTSVGGGAEVKGRTDGAETGKLEEMGVVPKSCLD